MLLAKRFPTFWNVENALDEMSRVFNMFDGPFGFRSMHSGGFPAINLYDNQSELVLTAEIPGVKLEDIELSVVENSVTLSGKRNGVQVDDKTRYYRQERPTGEFRRMITLNEKIDPDGVSAEYKDGILTVHLPRVKAAKPRSIEIKTQ